MPNKSSDKKTSILGKEDFFKIISSLVTILVIMGIIKASVYYLIFGINILEYAEWNEYFFFFLSDIGDLFYLVALFFIAFTITTYLNKLKDINKDSAEKYQIIFETGAYIILGFGLLSVSVKFLRHLLFKGIVGEIAIYSICFGLLLFLTSFYNSRKSLFSDIAEDVVIKKNKVPIIKAMETLAFVVILLSTIIILNVAPPYLKAYRLIQYPDKRKQISIYSKGLIIKESSDSILYIGKTNKFYFFFDRRLKKSSIINSTYVDSVQILRRPFKRDYKSFDLLY